MTCPSDLTSLAAVKQWLGLASTADDGLIASLITSVGRAILADLGRSSILPTVYSETFGEGDRRAITLSHWPATEILAVTLDGVALPASPGAGQAGYVLEQTDPSSPGAMQRLAFRGGVFGRGLQTLNVIYRAGYEILGEPISIPASAPYVAAAAAPFGAWVMDTGVIGAAGPYTVAGGVYTFTAADTGQAGSISYGYVPADLAQAALEWTADRYAARARIGQSAKTLGGQETTSFIVKAMPDVVDRLLQPYRRVAR